MQHRHGSAKYTNGGRYKGDFRCEHRWGWGRHIFPGGDHYEGQWMDDKIQGVRTLCSGIAFHASQQLQGTRPGMALQQLSIDINTRASG